MIKEPDSGYSPTQLEEEEQKTGYFTRLALSEFSRVVEEEKRKQRIGKLSYLRNLGRKERLLMAVKHGRRWQDA